MESRGGWNPHGRYTSARFAGKLGIRTPGGLILVDHEVIVAKVLERCGKQQRSSLMDDLPLLMPNRVKPGRKKKKYRGVIAAPLPPPMPKPFERHNEEDDDEVPGLRHFRRKGRVARKFKH